MKYSPRISEELIPVLYRTAKSRAMPMTRLVDRLITKALAVDAMPAEALKMLPPYSIFSAPHERPGGLDELISYERASPFRQTWEVEAWYDGCVHGLCRAVALHREQTTADSIGVDDLLQLSARMKEQCLLFLPPGREK